jgi:hypothetical protein
MSDRLSFRKIADRITGLSTPVFGISWTPPEDKREVVRRLVAFLEDRRALYQGFHMEYSPWVEQSVLEMRKELTNVLQTCAEDQELTGPIRGMRAACRKFLNEVGHPGRRHSMRNEAALWQALGELRGVFGLHLARLCAAYGVDVEPELATILPESDAEEAAGRGA